uniref:Uncharacterized protein n=1 Tax=viral metagenome TaxID=1070528 RepID=A0A6M3JYG4_9ZZZZ
MKLLGLYQLTRKERKYLDNWCKHDLLVAKKDEDGKWRFYDTYWNSDQTVYTYAEVKKIGTLRFIFDMNFAKEVSEYEWKKYKRNDTAYIPIGGGSARYLVDSRAKPDKKSIRLQLRLELAEAESEIRFRTGQIERLKQELTLN